MQFKSAPVPQSAAKVAEGSKITTKKAIKTFNFIRSQRSDAKIKFLKIIKKK